MRTRRAKGLWVVAALLAVNATLFVAQPGLALPGSLGKYFFGPKLVRAEVLVKDGGVLHDYRVDRGTIRNKAGGTLTLLERDGSLVGIPIAPTAAITINGRPVAYTDLRRGMVATGPGRRRAGERVEPTRDERGRGRASARRHAGRQLLLVEDEESIGSLVRSYLGAAGYRVVWVRSGEEALPALERHAIRLVVILDIGLPGIDGFDVCRGIRARSTCRS